MTPVHDGPVNMMLKSPFMDHLPLTMGGYSFAIWNEGIMVSIIIITFFWKKNIPSFYMIKISMIFLNSKST